ncbi:MAG: hypothetical protein R3F21_10880 [Myxococcota bacterium]
MAEPAARRSAAEGAGPAHLRHALRRALEQAQPEILVLAEGILAEASPIDLLAVGAEGELIAVRIAEPGDDLATLTRLLADLSWLRSRRADFLKLAAGNGIEPSAEPRGLLVAPSFGRETRAAVDHFPTDAIQLWLGRPGRGAEPVALRIERLDPIERPAELPPPRSASVLSAHAPLEPTPHPDRPAPPSTARFVPDLPPSNLPLGNAARPSAPPAGPPGPDRTQRDGGPGWPLTDPPSRSAFRTGLCPADLESSEGLSNGDRSH